MSHIRLDMYQYNVFPSFPSPFNVIMCYLTHTLLKLFKTLLLLYENYVFEHLLALSIHLGAWVDDAKPHICIISICAKWDEIYNHWWSATFELCESMSHTMTSAAKMMYTHFVRLGRSVGCLVEFVGRSVGRYSSLGWQIIFFLTTLIG